ncbi:MAG: hypothetical protein ACRDHB_04385 [Actinomycetota bacterium]
MRNARWILLAAGAAALVILFVVLRPGEDQEPSTQPTPSAAEPSPTPTETSEPSPTATGTLDAVEIEVEEGRVEGPARIRASQGDQVAIEVKADVTDQVHVHTYDLFFDVSPTQDAQIRFRADITGVFEIELEDAGLPLTMLEVSP